MGVFEVIQRCASYAEGCRYLVRRPACASLLSLGKRTRLGVVVGIAGYIYTYAGGVIYSCSRMLSCRFQVSRLRRVKDIHITCRRGDS
jgi:hypothetical protein